MKKIQKGLVSVIIITWNGLEHLKKCLPSIFEQNYKKIEVIIVDNGSVDESISWLNSCYPDVKIVKNKVNLGFAPANNQGYEKAGGEYILFLNNDTRVTNPFLTELLRVLKSDDSIGGVQSKILLMDSPKRLDSVGSYLTNTGFLYHLGVYANDSEEFSREIEVYSAKGACMLFKRDVLERIRVEGEILDGRYFAYFEETDMCHRVWLAGYKILYVPTSIIYHKFGATSIKLLKPFVEYHSYKNRINSYIKNLGFYSFLKIFPVHLAICEVLSLVFVFRKKIEISWAIQKAIWWNIINLIPTLKKRKIIQSKIRKLNDAIIFPYVIHNPAPSFYLSQLKGWNVDLTKTKNVKR